MMMMKKMEIQMLVMMVRERKNSQRESVRVVNVDVVMPTRHVTDDVVRLSNGHGDSFNRQQPSYTHGYGPHHTYRDWTYLCQGGQALVSVCWYPMFVRVRLFAELLQQVRKVL